MKRTDKIPAIILAIMLLSTGFAFARDWYWANDLEGGGARDIDSLQTSTLNDGDLAIVTDQDTDSGNSTYRVFRFDANSSASGQTGYIPSIVRPDDFSAAGVWREYLPADTVKSENFVTNSQFAVFSKSDGPYKMSGVSVDSVSAGVVTLAADPDEDPVVGKILTFGGSGSDYTSTGVSVYVVTAVSSTTSFTLNGGLGIDTGVTDAYWAAPGNTGDNEAPDYWLMSTANLHAFSLRFSDKTKTDYGLRLVSTSNDKRLFWVPGDIYDMPYHYRQFQGRTITVGCWVYQSGTTGTFDIDVFDNGNGGYNDVTSADTTTNQFEWIEGTYTISDSCTGFEIVLDADNGCDVYVSGIMAVFGEHIGEGNYRPIPQEVIFFEEEVQCEGSDGSVDFWGGTYSSDLSFWPATQSDGKIPTFPKAHWWLFSFEAAGAEKFVLLGDQTDGTYQFFMYTQAANQLAGGQGWVATVEEDGGSVDVNFANSTFIVYNRMQGVMMN